MLSRSITGDVIRSASVGTPATISTRSSNMRSLKSPENFGSGMADASTGANRRPGSLGRPWPSATARPKDATAGALR
eukprot:12091599-Alexandrium_andersonii.AAC.1